MNTHARVEGLSVAGRLFRFVFRGWQQVRAGRPSPCRFTPTCSQYGIESVEQHGAVRGTVLAARRVLRCHPWGSFGYDPVPAAALPTPHPHSKRRGA